MKMKKTAALIAILASLSLAAAPITVCAEETETEPVTLSAEDETESDEVNETSDSEDTEQFFKDLYGKTVMNDYEKRTGNTAANYTCVLPTEGNQVTVTLTDENGEVLDVYTFDGETGIGTNQNGDAIDVTEFMEEVPEEEYFVPFDQMSDVAARCYEETTGERPTGSSTMIDLDDSTKVIIELFDENENELETYTVDLRTGVGTDSAGNEVDLSAYAAVISIDESDYFAPVSVMDDAAINLYREQTGVKPVGVMIDADPKFSNAVITLFDENDNELETYTVGLTTGFGTDSAGNEVNLNDYTSEPALDESELFIPEAIMDEAAEGYYAELTGTEPAGAIVMLDLFIPEAEISLYDSEGNEIETYVINPLNGIGTDTEGNLVDLAEYADTHEITDTVPPVADDPDESEYFAPSDDIMEYALVDYQTKTGTEANYVSFEADEDNQTATLEIYDENDNVIETYTIDVKTGIGTDSAGNAVDLSQYAEAVSVDESDYFAPVYVMDDAAINLYRGQTGVKPAGVSVEANPAFSSAVITLFDEDDNELETYSVGLTTGFGTDSAGNEVNLNDYTSEPALDESELFIPEAIMDEAAEGYYAELTGTEPAGAIVMLDLFIPETEISLYDSKGNEIETYVINPLNGIGTDAKGNLVDLASYADTHEITDTVPPVWDEPDESEYFAPSDDIMTFALVDYQQKTGTEANYVSFEPDADNQTAAIEFYDEDDNVVETYTIDVKTGIGTDSAGNEVNLPQTGILSPDALLAAIGALLLTCGGAWCIRRSGILGKNQ